MNGTTSVEVGDDGVAVITINNPPLNLLSVNVLLSLKRSIEEAVQRDDVKAIILIGSKGYFSAGFDVTAFGARQGKKTMKELGFMSLEFVTDTLEAARKPLVAAVEGLALGGGFEIALACHARISTSAAKLGLPELQYGILPGLGGTQRLPRLVGLSKALDMILMSKRINGEEALTAGLVDAIAPADRLLGTARQWALDILESRRPQIISLYRTDKLVPLAEVRIILKSARDQIQKLSPSLTHLSVCIDVIEHGIVCGPRDGLLKEAEALHELRQSNTCRSLVHIFFAQRETSKLPGITNIGLSPRNIGNIAVIGGGLIGSGIATVLVLNNFNVVLKEENEASLQNGIGRVKANLESHVNKGKMTREQFKKTFTRIKGVLSYEGFEDLDLVIEAMPEIPSSKERIFADLEKHCSRDCILASSSSVNLNLIVQTRLLNRIVGFHLFSALPVFSLLEIVRTEKTSSQAIVNLLNFGRKIRRTPVVFRNCSGSVVNRMLIPYFQAAFLLAEHGADVSQIDSAIASFGIPLGPFRMIDLIGFQSAIGIITKFVENFPDRSYKSLLIPAMLKDNYEGESTGKGFYVYDDKGRNQPNPSILKCIKEARNLSGISIKLEVTRLSDEEILEMILFPVVNEACRIISEGIADKASDLDITSVMGMGFPSYRGGIIFWSDIIGAQHICARLDDWSMKYGNFYRPSAYLMEQASKQGSLGAGNQQKSKSRSQL